MAFVFRRAILAAAMAVVVLLFATASSTAVAVLTAAQQTNTLAFLQSFTTTIPGLATAWTGSDWCTWDYIDCTTETNITLIIDGAELTGSLPPLASGVTGASVALHTIALMNMNITSGFPDSWAALTALQTLNLANTDIFGTLPQSWNAMTNIASVFLANSSACGNLPNWTRISMVNIDLGNNYLRGTLPSLWSAMTRLQNVTVSGNYICGCVPETWIARALQYAALRSLGYYSYDQGCRNTPRCAALQECSRGVPNYNAAVGPAGAVVAALTLAAVLASTLLGL